MINSFHHEILRLIKENSGKATQHTFLDSYLRNSHPRYAISAPVLRTIARNWMSDHRHLDASELADLVTSLVKGESGTEKSFAGILLDYTTSDQRNFDPVFFEHWLDHLEGWAEVDAMCTGKYQTTHLLPNFKKWKPLLVKFSKDENINKRRASLVMLCSPVSGICDERLESLALDQIERLKSEKDIMITRAISWLLRSMIKHYKTNVKEYLQENKETLPKIAVRETLVKLKTGTKSGKTLKATQPKK
jgi:3-methyladenine DNA glycosylase AlkD